MHTVYIACLVGGALATAVFAMLGAVGGGHGGIGGRFHVGHAHAPAHAPSVSHGVHAAAHGHAHAVVRGHGASRARVIAGRTEGLFARAAGWTLSWISPLTVAAAALWFGGVGLLSENALGPLALILAIVAALAGAFLVRLAVSSLVAASTPPLSLSAEGALATVNATIRAGGTGEVIFSLEGLTRSLPARSLDGAPIPRGVNVAIVKRERGMAWVARLDENGENDLAALETTLTHNGDTPLKEEMEDTKTWAQ